MTLISGFQNPSNSFSGSDLGSRGATMRYPHPWFDVAQTYIPVTIKHLFRWCHIYYQMNPIVNNVINRMAEYPVTSLNFKAKNERQEEVFEDIFRNLLNLEAFCIDCNVDYYVFGNAYISVHYPVTKYLICKNCKTKHPITSVKYKFESFKFHLLSCPQCHSSGEADVQDVTIPSKHGLRLVRWDPANVDVIYNEVTGHASYVLAVPQKTAQSIRQGNPLFLNETPQVFIDAVAKGHRILLSPYNIFHMRRKNVAGKDLGIGQPLVLPVLKDLYLMQVLKKAQEAIAQEHIVPLRIIHPMAAGNTDPISTLDLASWQNTMRGELTRWRNDPNYTPIVPLPIGFQYMGGQGKSLMLVNEIKQMAEMVVMGMNVPIEFAFGGQSFSGSSVTLRMLENQFLRNQTQMTKMVKFLVKSIANFLNIDSISAEFTSIRTADDIQRKQILMQMAQANKISDQTLLAEFNIDPEDELVRIEEEMSKRSRLEGKQFLENAENQGKAQKISAKYEAEAQIESQKIMASHGMTPGMQPGTDPTAEGQPGGAPQGGPVTPEQLQSIIKELSKLSDSERATAIEELKQYLDPQAVQQIIAHFTGKKQKEDAKGAMKPLPEKLPPRRSPEKQVV